VQGKHVLSCIQPSLKKFFSRWSNVTKIRTSKTKRLNEILSIVKLFALLFSGVGLYVSIYGKTEYSYTSLFAPISLMAIFALIYIIWSNISLANLNQKSVTLIQYVENYLFILVFAAVVYYSGANESKNKFLFLFIIISSSIQLGMRAGLITAAVSASIVLGMDLIAVQNVAVNTYFEADLVIAALFIIMAWLIGHYVNIEKEFFERMENLAHTDELTGLFNHRYFYDTLRENIRRNKQTSTLAIVLLDIDSFKYYNDLFGHQKGDSVLIDIAEILMKHVKPTDVAARYAGDEFAILMPDMDEEKALKVAENIRKEIEEKRFDGQENMPDRNLTVSIGVSIYPHKASSEHALIKSADDALYRAKFFNKNRVESYISILDALKEDIEEEHIDLITSMKTLITIINSKDRYTYGHVERVVIYAKMFAEHLGLSETDRNTLIYGAYMHDLGKINIPEEVLNKQMPLTEDEWHMIKMHPANGVKIVEPVNPLKSTIPIILHHHERFDGTGYPDRLKGEEIPYLARVLTVIDSFDAMTFKRSYNEKKTFDDAIAEIRACKGAQFDPVLVEQFVEAFEENRDRISEL